jgi:hypothetical protein
MLPILQGSLITVGPWFSTHGRKGLRVYPYQRGGRVETASTSTTIALDRSGDIAVNDYIMVCTKGSYGDDNVWTPVSTKIAKVTAVSSDTLTIDGSGLSVAVGDYVLNLGADTGGTSPNFDGSDITLYDDPAGAAASANEYLLTGSSAGFIGWTNRGAIECDLLVTDSSDFPLSVEIAKPLLLQRLGYAYRGTRPTLTLSGDTLTLPGDQSSSEVVVAAETSTTDTLSSINGGVAGDLLFLTADAGDTITVDEAGDISLAGTTVELSGDVILVLRYDGTTWDEVSLTSEAGSAPVLTVTTSGDVTVIDTLLDETSVGGSEQSFSLGSIPQDYDFIEIELTGIRGRDSAGQTTCALTFNADAGNNYDYAQLSYGGASTHTEGNINAAFIGLCPDSNDRAAAVGHGWARIYGYADTGNSTKVMARMGTADNTSGDSDSRCYDTTWLSTAAVTALAIKNYTGETTFAAGTRCVIRGYKTIEVVTSGSLGVATITNGMIVP